MLLFQRFMQRVSADDIDKDGNFAMIFAEIISRLYPQDEFAQQLCVHAYTPSFDSDLAAALQECWRNLREKYASVLDGIAIKVILVHLETIYGLSNMYSLATSIISYSSQNISIIGGVMPHILLPH